MTGNQDTRPHHVDGEPRGTTPLSLELAGDESATLRVNLRRAEGFIIPE